MCKNNALILDGVGFIETEDKMLILGLKLANSSCFGVPILVNYH